MQFGHMITSGTTRVFVAAIFMAAMFYASFCSTMRCRLLPLA